MTEFILKFHSTWAFIVVAFIIVAAITTIFGFVTKKEFNAKFKKLYLFTLIASHIQLLIGFVSYFFASQRTGVGYYKVEHLATMILIIVFVTVGNRRFKKIQKFDIIQVILYVLALLLLLPRLQYGEWLS